MEVNTNRYYDPFKRCHASNFPFKEKSNVDAGSLCEHLSLALHNTHKIR